MVEDCELYAKKQVSVAMMVFYMTWLNYFGDPDDRVINNLNVLLIQWSSENKRGDGYDEFGVKYENARYSGLTLSRGIIWVKAQEKDRLICETSFVHELVHASIWAVKLSDGDPDHNGTKYSGWTSYHTTLIMRVNKTLCELGI